MNFQLSCGLIVLSLLALPALAANKCIDPGGRISYQADPCPANSRGGDMSLNVNRPFSGQSEKPATDPSSFLLVDQTTLPSGDKKDQENHPADAKK